MIADQTITINAVPHSVPRVSSGVSSSKFRKDNGDLTMIVSHQKGRGGRTVRSMIRLDHRKVAQDPMVTAQNLQYSMSTWLALEKPEVGYTVAEAKQIVDGFIAALNASTGLLITKLLGEET